MDIFKTTALAHIKGNPSFERAAYRVITPEDFATAIAEISAWQGHHETPLYHLNGLAAKLGFGDIAYKDEGPRFGLGSFKALGGSYAALRVLAREISRRLGKDVTLSDIRAGLYRDTIAGITLVSATDGNHGRSLAWGCQRFGAPCRIYIHAEVSEGRAEAMREFGAEVVRISGDYDESVALARSEAEANGWFVVSDTSWPGYSEPPRDVMAGYGVMMDEVARQLQSPPSHLFLQGGVGGLAASVAAASRQIWGDAAPRIVIVEPDRAACLFASARAGKATSVAIETETIMAGLSCGEPSEMAWEILREEASDFLTISDEIVAPTVRLLARPGGNDPVINAGESAIAGLAALIALAGHPDLAAKLALDATSRILLIGSEGVTDPEIFARIMAGGAG